MSTLSQRHVGNFYLFPIDGRPIPLCVVHVDSMWTELKRRRDLPFVLDGWKLSVLVNGSEKVPSSGQGRGLWQKCDYTSESVWHEVWHDGGRRLLGLKPSKRTSKETRDGEWGTESIDLTGDFVTGRPRTRPMVVDWRPSQYEEVHVRTGLPTRP